MTAPTDPRAEYTRRTARWTEIIARGERTHVQVSNARLGTAAVAAVLAWLAFFRGALSPLWFLVAGLVFLTLIVVHVFVLQRNERSARARGFYQRGLARMDGAWAGSGPDGARFASEHAYARDLDLFGPASLFQLLTTARTEAGEETLADWMRAPATVAEIRARQDAVAELRGRIDFREDLAVLAAEAHVGRTAALNVWAKAPSVGLSLALGATLATAALTTVVALVAVSGERVGPWALATALLIEFLLVSLWRRPLHDVLHRIETPSLDLRLLTQLIKRVEREAFESSRLVALHARLVRSGTCAACSQSSPCSIPR